jgi:cytochrome c2
VIEPVLHHVRAALRALLGACLVAVTSGVTAGVADPGGAHFGPEMNYRLHCEGCHKQDGSGQTGFVPDFRGNIARFLALPEGRDYLVRVPGTAQSLLTDAERAAVLNWVLVTMDPGNLPENFEPYTEAEVGRWRYDALSNPLSERARLLARLDVAGAQVQAITADDSSPGTAGALPAKHAAPPAAFAICTSCHSTSRDGSHSMGPNLFGVVGRQAGSITGFAFSPAMRGSGVSWSPEKLDAYLAAPAREIPGNFMVAAPVKDPAARKAIIDYLSSLH